jgi:hypothetical protein
VSDPQNHRFEDRRANYHLNFPIHNIQSFMSREVSPEIVPCVMNAIIEYTADVFMPPVSPVGCMSNSKPLAENMKMAGMVGVA